MDFGLTAEHAALQERVERFCKEHCTEAHAAALDREPGYPVELHHALADAGLLGWCLPAAYGGRDGGPIEACLVNEGLGRHSSAATNVLFINGVAAALVAFAGTEEQKQDYVRGVASGALRFAFALTEPGAGSDAAAIATRAVRDGDHYVVHGTKLYTTGARDADYILTVVRTRLEGKASQGTSLLVVPRPAPGLTVTPLARRSRATASLRAASSTTACASASSSDSGPSMAGGRYSAQQGGRPCAISQRCSSPSGCSPHPPCGPTSRGAGG
jgi:hypothetical protein